jgi:hypothetical protein
MNDKPTETAPPTEPALALAVTRVFSGYALVDSGHGRTLERFGAVTVDRPEEQATHRLALWPIMAFKIEGSTITHPA